MRKAMVLVFILCAFSGFYARRWSLNQQKPPFAGFSFETITRITAIKNGVSTEIRSLHAVRGDGSYLQGTYNDQGQIIAKRLILSNYTIVVADLVLRLKSTEHRDPATVQTSVPDPGCTLRHGAEELLGNDTYANISVVKWRQTTSDKQGAKIVREVWEAPGLGCMALHGYMHILNPQGSEVSSTEVVTSKIRFGEPDPNLFEIPLDFKEVSPSAMVSARYLVNGLPFQMNDQLIRIDNRYYNSPTKKGSRPNNSQSKEP